MDKEQIKVAVDFQFAQIKKWSKEKSEHENKIRLADENMKEIHKEVVRVRSMCNHTYIGKKYGVMGRGICEICGNSDY